jgi:adenylate cyclase
LLADTLPNLTEDVRADLRSQPSNDEVFAQAMADGRVVLGQTATYGPMSWTGEGPPPQTGVAVVGVGEDPARALMQFPGLIRNVPVLEAAAAGRGVFTISPERDGVVRRIPMIVSAGGAIVPTLTLEILRVLTEAGSLLVQTDETGVAGIRLPEFAVATDRRGQVWVRFSPHEPDRFVSARDIIAGTVPEERFKHKVVLVGTTAVGLFDNRTTPIDRSMPGVEIHAQLLENLLTGTTLVNANHEIAIELLAAAAVSVLIIVFAPILGAINILLSGSVVAILLAFGSWHFFVNVGLLIDATFPLAASFSVCLTIIFTNYLREQLGRARIRSAFSRYVSPALVERLAESREQLKLGGEERCVTVMFSDLRGFTSISEFYKPDPAGLVELVNRVLTPLTNAILAHRGTIDKYMGDAIMAFWNAPLEDPEHEINAAGAALEMLARLDELNALRRAEAESGGHPVLPLGMGMGVNTGLCVVGNIGSDLRFDYSLLGDPVNVASRLEGQSRFYGVPVVLGNATARAIREVYAVLEIDLIQVKGKSEPETVSTLVGNADLRASPRFSHLAQRHAAMIAAFRERRWRETASLAGECRTLADGLRLDSLYDLYQSRAADYEREPPPADWAGVYVALTK